MPEVTITDASSITLLGEGGSFEEVLSGAGSYSVFSSPDAIRLAEAEGSGTYHVAMGVISIPNNGSIPPNALISNVSLTFTKVEHSQDLQYLGDIDLRLFFHSMSDEPPSPEDFVPFHPSTSLPLVASCVRPPVPGPDPYTFSSESLTDRFNTRAWISGQEAVKLMLVLGITVDGNHVSGPGDDAYIDLANYDYPDEALHPVITVEYAQQFYNDCEWPNRIYDPTDGTCLCELIRLVRMRLGDFPERRTQVEESDGTTNEFRMRDNIFCFAGVGVTEEEEGVEVIVPAEDYKVEYDTGWVVLAGALSGTMRFKYTTTVWSDERIVEAVNASIEQLFAAFYVRGENDAVITPGGGEIDVTTRSGAYLGPEDRITGVEWWDGWRWRRLDSWRVRSSPRRKTVVFSYDPPKGQRLRISYVTRPGMLTVGAHTLECTAGLPTRAKEPIVLYATSMLIGDRIHARIRDDRGHNTQNENAVKSYEIQNDAQWLRSQAELAVSRLRMDALVPRVSF